MSGHAICRFCELRHSADATQFGSVYVITDAYPVADGHALIIPVRHCKDVFEMTAEEMADTQHALNVLRSQLEGDGFNVGWNAGTAAGQTVAHAHCHVIPRHIGDVSDPTGGIRGVIPERRTYLVG